MKKHPAILLALGLYLSLTSPAAAQDTENKEEFDDTVHVVQRKQRHGCGLV